MALSKNLVTIASSEIPEYLRDGIEKEEFLRAVIENAAQQSGFSLDDDYSHKMELAAYALPETLNRLADKNKLGQYQVFPILNHRNEYETTTSLVTGTVEELEKFDNTKVVGWELFSGSSGSMSLVMEQKPMAYVQWVLQSGDEGNVTLHGSYAREEEAIEEVADMCKRNEFVEGLNLSKVEYADDDTLAGTTFAYRPTEEVITTMCVTTMEEAPKEGTFDADFYMVSLFAS